MIKALGELDLGNFLGFMFVLLFGSLFMFVMSQGVYESEANSQTFHKRHIEKVSLEDGEYTCFVYAQVNTGGISCLKEEE